MISVLEGGCACNAVRYELHGAPMIVHACHCTDCQRLGGAPYAINAWTEAHNVVLIKGEPATAMLAGGESGKPCETAFCQDCGTTLWVYYHVSPPGSRFVKGGTLDQPGAIQPDVHIWTRSSLPYTSIPDDVPVFEQFYDLKEVWPAESLARLKALIAAGESAP